jgi:hypothetical protein
MAMGKKRQGLVDDRSILKSIARVWALSDEEFLKGVTDCYSVEQQRRQKYGGPLFRQPVLSFSVE